MGTWLSFNTLYTFIKYAAGAGAFGAAIAATALWYYQCKLIYPSNVPQGARTNVPTPADVGLPYEDVTITTSDGLKIKGYVLPVRKTYVSTLEIQQMSPAQRTEQAKVDTETWAKEIGTEEAIQFVKSRPTVIIFHANAGNMGHRVPIARKFNTDLRCNVFMLSYRGYGLSEGFASEHGIRKDVDAAIEYVSQHPLLKGTKLIVYGQSIGGAVCLYAGSKYSELVSGIIIENTFVSLSSLIPLILPAIPKFLIPLLLTEKWDAAKAMPHIPPTTPVLFMSGKRDQLVPPAQMKALLRLRGEGKKRWREFDGEHNDTFLAKGYWDEVDKWLKEEVEGVEK